MHPCTPQPIDNEETDLERWPASDTAIVVPRFIANDTTPATTAARKNAIVPLLGTHSISSKPPFQVGLTL